MAIQPERELWQPPTRSREAIEAEQRGLEAAVTRSLARARGVAVSEDSGQGLELLLEGTDELAPAENWPPQEALDVPISDEVRDEPARQQFHRGATGHN
ncbi:MAG TPA: hypothetical protein VIJ68_00330 [Candidatus Saccharimonadales bacterium]